MTEKTKAPEFTLEDTRGASVSLADYRGKNVIVIFASQATQEASAKAASTLGKNLLQKPDIVMITVVAVPKMFKMMAQGVLKAAQEKALSGARKRFEKEGAEAPADLDKRVFILPDWNGALVKQYGFDPKAKMVHITAIGPDGEVVERVSSAEGEKAADAIVAKLS